MGSSDESLHFVWGNRMNVNTMIIILLVCACTAYLNTKIERLSSQCQGITYINTEERE